MDGPLFDAMLKNALEEALRQDAEEAAGRIPARRPSVKHRSRMRGLLSGTWGMRSVRWAAAIALAALLTGTAAGYALGGGAMFRAMFEESPWAAIYGGAADTEQLLEMGGHLDTMVVESGGLRFEMLDAVSDGQMAMVSVRLTVLEGVEALLESPGQMEFASCEIAPAGGKCVSSYGISTRAWLCQDGLQEGQYELLFTVSDASLTEGGQYEICLTDFCVSRDCEVLLPGEWTLAVTLRPAGVRTVNPGRTCQIEGTAWRLERLAISPLALTMDFRSLEEHERMELLNTLEDTAVRMADGRVIRWEDCTSCLNGSPETFSLTMEFQMPLNTGQVQSVRVCGEEIFLTEMEN